MADHPHPASLKDFDEKAHTTTPGTRLVDDVVPGDSALETIKPSQFGLDSLRTTTLQKTREGSEHLGLSGDLSGTRESALAADAAEAVTVAADENVKSEETKEGEEGQSSETLPAIPLQARRDTFASACTDSESDSAPAGEEFRPEGEPKNGRAPTPNERQDAFDQFPGPSRNHDPSTNLVPSHRVSPTKRKRSTAFGAQSVVVDFLTSREGSVEHFVGRFPVHKVLGGMDRDFSSEGSMAGPSKLMHEAKLTQGKSLAEPTFRWIHLPSNNMEWFEKLTTMVCQERLAASKSTRSSSREYMELILRHDKWTANQHGSAGRSFHTRFMKPTCSTTSITIEQLNRLTGREDPQRHTQRPLLLYMPYLHWERQRDQLERRRIIGAIHLIPQSKLSLPERAMRAYLKFPSPLHIRRTLDQYFHVSLKDTQTRDNDQVVNRYVRDILKLPDPPIMMVDQLWLCILDDGLIITAFPTRFDREHNPDGRGELLERILGHLAKGVVSPLELSWDLAILIIDHASDFFFQTSQLPPDLRFVEFFANSISAVSDKTTTCFTKFNNLVAHVENLRASTDPASLRELSRALDSHSNISSETFLIREIQDIIDELNSILKVYKEQAVIATLLKKEYYKIVNLATKQDWKDSAVRHEEKETSATGLPARNVSKGLKHADERIEDWAEVDPVYAIEERKLEFGGLILQAERIYNALRDILDLRQKQANLSEAWSSRKQAEQSSKVAAEAIKQGRSILLFTVVTIIFLPLSFISSIFGMNAKELNQANYGLGLILPILFCVSTAVIGLALLLAFNAPFRTVCTNLLDLAWAFFLTYTRLLSLWKCITPINVKLQKYRDMKLKQIYQLEKLPTSKAELQISEEEPSAIGPSGVTRPTYILVRREHLDPETLDFYKLPWEWHDQDSNYIVIKKWIPEQEQELLFEHTKRLRQRREETRKRHSAVGEPPEPPSQRILIRRDSRLERLVAEEEVLILRKSRMQRFFRAIGSWFGGPRGISDNSTYSIGTNSRSVVFDDGHVSESNVSNRPAELTSGPLIIRQPTAELNARPAFVLR